MMKKIVLLLIILPIAIVVSGCDKSHNFMDIDNPNAKEDLQNVIKGFGSGKTSDIIPSDIIPDALSGTFNNVKGHAQKYYEDTVEEYVDAAKGQLSGAVKSLKGYYNSGVDQLTNAINDKITSAVNDELNKIKL